MPDCATRTSCKLAPEMFSFQEQGGHKWQHQAIGFFQGLNLAFRMTWSKLRALWCNWPRTLNRQQCSDTYRRPFQFQSITHVLTKAKARLPPPLLLVCLCFLSTFDTPAEMKKHCNSLSSVLLFVKLFAGEESTQAIHPRTQLMLRFQPAGGRVDKK